MVGYGDSNKAYRALVKTILARATSHVWSLQGFGMLRLHLGDESMRLNLWAKEFRVAHVSDMHTHPWHFDSHVVSGRLVNDVYMEVRPNDPALKNVLRMRAQTLKPGPGGGLVSANPRVQGSPSRLCHVVRRSSQMLLAGDSYRQEADEIHVSMPDDGTVTLNWRERDGRPDEAIVYWPAGTEWVSAEPRKATDKEVSRFVALVNARWDLP